MPRPSWARPRHPACGTFTPSTSHCRWPEYTCRRSTPGALQSRRAARRAQRCRQRPRRLVPTQAAADASPALSLLFLSGGLVVPSLPGSRLVGGRHCRWTRPQGADGIPITVRGGRYFIYRPPLGSRRPSDPEPMVRIHPIQTSLERTGLFSAPRPRVVVPWHCLAGLRRALLSPCSALRRTSSHHGHGRQWPSSPPPLLPTNLTPAGRLPPPSMARRLSGASQTSPRRQFLPRPPRHVVWHGRRRVPACGAIYTRSTRTVRDSTPWRTEEQHGARATG